MSIWFSWWLARRDIKRKLEDAQRRVALALLSGDTAELVRCTREVRDAVRRREWDRAILRFEDISHLVSRLREHPQTDTAEKPELESAAEVLAILLSTVEKLRETRTQTPLTKKRRELLDGLTRTFSDLDSRLRSRLSEDADGRKT